MAETNISPNIRILRFSQVSHEQYYALAELAFCIVISVDNEKSPCGQLMINFAMENAKPIIATDSFGSRDYIINNFNGILFKLGKSEAIQKAYQKLKDDVQFRENIINNAKETAEKMHPSYFIKKVLLILESDCSFKKREKSLEVH